MTIYDENKHPRGQAGNAGQFRDKSNSGPEAVPLAPKSVASPFGAMYLGAADADAIAAEWASSGDEGAERAATWEKFKARSISYEQVRESDKAAVTPDGAQRAYLRVMGTAYADQAAPEVRTAPAFEPAG